MLKLHSLVGCPFCVKIQYVLQALSIDHEVTHYTKLEDIKTDAYLRMNPKGEAPTLETKEGYIYESGAIMRYLASLRPELKLNGSNNFEAAQIEMWMSNAGPFCGSVAMLYVQIVGKIPGQPENLKANIENIHSKIEFLEKHLLPRTYLVGNQITLADLNVLPFLNILYFAIFDEKERVKYPNILRYWKNLTASSVHTSIFGNSAKRLCHKLFPLPEKAPAQAAPAKEDKKASKKASKKEEKPKEAKQEKPKEQKKAEEVETSFDMFNFKTLFVNEKDRKSVVDFALKNYDKECFSFWHAEYDMHPKEGKELVPTNNLLTNFVQRVNDLNLGRNLIAVHGIYGDEPELKIRGMWFWKSKDFYEAFKDHPGCEYVKWTKLDPSKPEDVKRLEEYWSNIKSEEGTVEGAKCRTLKIVK